MKNESIIINKVHNDLTFRDRENNGLAVLYGHSHNIIVTDSIISSPDRVLALANAIIIGSKILKGKTGSDEEKEEINNVQIRVMSEKSHKVVKMSCKDLFQHLHTGNSDFYEGVQFNQFYWEEGMIVVKCLPVAW